ncbi:response regulator [Chryseobacterium sp.]|uniref:response regulator n=1 Tax=Chryseobacterium sp. TaxID=1871047 RepID=UPI0038904377
MKENKKFKFLLADDHSLIRQGILFLIEDLEINCDIIQASNLQQVLEILDSNTIDMAIIDAHFPDGNSLNILPDIRKKCPYTKIMIFTGVDEYTQALKFLNAGAGGFLSKMSEEEEIKKAILKMHETGEYLSPTTQALLLNSLRNKGSIDPISLLSERELQIAKLYVEGLGNLEIANHLDVKQNTISTVKKRIFDKLNIDNIVELIEIFKDHR